MEKKDYYKVLGVASDAEEIIIRAAYKALVQKYHPDKFDGTEEEADKRIRELNEAYETLSSPVKRKAYDEQLNSESSTNKKNHTKSKEDNEWGLAVSYYSDLPAISSRLSVFSDELARNFRSYILSTKKYDKRHAIASKYEKDFLKNNFGKNPVVVDFATSLFLSGKKEAANELSQTLSVLGDAKFEKIIMNNVVIMTTMNQL